MSPTMPLPSTAADRAAGRRTAAGRRRHDLAAAFVALSLLIGLGVGTGTAAAQSVAGNDMSARDVDAFIETGGDCTLRFLPGRERLFDCRIDAGWGPTLLSLFVDRSAPAPDGWLATSRLQLYRLDADNDFERYLVEDRPLEDGLVRVEGDRVLGFTLEDLDFDGYVDFRLLSDLPADGNYTYRAWIYDIGRDAFLIDRDLSALSRPTFDAAEGMITETVFALPDRAHRTIYQWEGTGTAATLAFVREEACQRTEEDLVYREIDGAVGNRRLPLRRELVDGNGPDEAMARCLANLDLVPAG